MSKKLFVGNIDWNTTQEDLSNLFSELGEVEEAVIITDKFTGRSRGFGFVTYSDDSVAEQAVEKFNGHDLNGRELTVNEARPREERKPRNDF